jgi:uncharacterized protein (DUF1015 family)
MADVRPFRGIAYDEGRVGSYALVVSEPYDKVTEAMRKAYLDACPFHIVRIDLPREDEPRLDRYARAASTFRQWLAAGILRRAERPALYLYEQGFALPARGRLTRRAFVGLVEAGEYGEGRVLPHERTFREPKADRLALLEAARAHFGMCFLLYRDGKRAAIGALEAAAAGRAPLAEFALPDGTTHRVIPVEDPGAIAAVRAVLRERTCVIADGHHRYETQVAFRREHEKKKDLRPAHRFRLAAFVEAEDPGLVILPTHRLLPRGVTPERFLEAARPWLEPLCDPSPLVSIAGQDPPRVFAVHGPEGPPVYLRTRPLLDLERELPELPRPVRRLAVTILHRLVLERGLGIEAGSKEHALGYVRWPEEGLLEVRAGKYGSMVCLEATRVEDVIEAAESGAVMPQKSTDFYPKLLTGLLMNDIEDDLYG